MLSQRPFLSRVRIVNYKSIESCDVSLRPLSVLVGRNGAGKSNFLDALRFVTESLQGGMDHAIKTRGGIDGVRRRSTGHPFNFSIELQIALPERSCEVYRALSPQVLMPQAAVSAEVIYGFEVTARKPGGFQVKREELRVLLHNQGEEVLVANYLVQEGRLEAHSAPSMPPLLPDRLYLVNAAGLPEFRPVYDALSAIGFYNLNPESIRELQSPDTGELLLRDGANLASVLANLRRNHPAAWERLMEHLSRIAPGVEDIERVPLGPRETLLFRQRVSGAQIKFYASSMSDGTLRALGTLLSVAQLTSSERPINLVGIEEPETALHPAAAAELMGALREATGRTQVLLTTHSPDLLDQLDSERDQLLIARWQPESCATMIAMPEEATLRAVKDDLYSLGSLHRLDQLSQDENDLLRQRQLPLFSESK